MRKSYLTLGFLWVALASLPAAAQSSTTSPAQKPRENPAQSTQSQAAPGQSGAASDASKGQAQTRDENPLNLTDEQKAKLQPILAEENQQFDALRNNTTMTQEQKVAKANEVRQAAAPKIRAILTPEQLQKLDDLQQKAKQRQNQTPPADGAKPPQQ